jgi:PAS domain S-box-containing protein
MSVLKEVHNQILSAIQVNVAILDADGVIVDVSDSWNEFAAANGGALGAVGVGVNYLDVCRRSVGSADAAATRAGILSVINGCSPRFRRMYRCDGPNEPRLFSMTVSPIRSGTRGVIVAHHNNSEIETAEALYSSLLDSVQAIVWRADLPGFKTTFASKQAEEILGYPAERWTSEPTWWIEHVHPDDRDWVLRFTSAAVEERRSHTFDYRMIAADARVVWLRNIVNVVVEGTTPREVVGVSIDITERKNAERMRDQFTGQLLAAQEEERRAIARELHDDIGQSVAFLNFALSNLRKRVGVSDVVAELDDLSNLVAKIDKDLARVSHGLHPVFLEHVGLAASVRHLCGELGGRRGLAIECTIGDGPGDLNIALVTTMYRVCQEALRNVAKHSEATHVAVELSASPTHIRLSVNDNGAGFDVAAVGNLRGLGLTSMNERLKLVGGSLEVTSKLGEGTRIEATIPLSSQYA